MYSKNKFQPSQQVFTADLSQAAGTYDLATASDDCLVQLTVIYVSTAGATWTSTSIQTDHTTAFTFLSAGDGIVANFTSQANLTPTSQTKWCFIPRGKKIQYTITGATGTGAAVCYFNVVKVKEAGKLS